MKLSYPAVFYPNEKGGYVVEVPDLPGLATEGDDMADAIFMAVDAASGYVLGELEDGNTAPVASSLSDIKPEPDGIVSLIALDMDSYAAQYGNAYVRKNISIPAWQETYVKKHNLSLSELMQKAIDSLADKEKRAV